MTAALMRTVAIRRNISVFSRPENCQSVSDVVLISCGRLFHAADCHFVRVVFVGVSWEMTDIHNEVQKTVARGRLAYTCCRFYFCIGL